MIVNHTRPAGRAGPNLLTIVAIFMLLTVALAPGPRAGSSNSVDQSLNLQASADVGNIAPAHNPNGDDLIISLLFHSQPKEGAQGVCSGEVIGSIVDALNVYYKPRGILFQHAIDNLNGSEFTDVMQSDRNTISSDPSESCYNVYLATDDRPHLSSADGSSDPAYSQVRVGKDGGLEQARLVRDLGQEIAEWYTLQTSARLSAATIGHPDQDWIAGDVDGNGQGPDVADLVYMAAFMFRGGPRPPVLQAADLAGTVGVVDIADMIQLVDHLFGEHSGAVGGDR